MNFLDRSCLTKKNLRKGKFIFSRFFSLILLLLLTCCADSKKSPVPFRTFELTQDERAWLQDFFRDLLFKNPGAFTLFGTKPMSETFIYHYTDEYKNEMEEYAKTISKEKLAEIRKIRYDYSENYKKWQQIKDRFPIRQYLFGSYPIPSEEQIEMVIFINIEETLRTLVTYYEDFRRVLGYDFDPFLSVFEVENKESEFWKAVLQSHALRGILLGYGRDNAWFFNWELRKNVKSFHREFLTSLPKKPSEDADIDDYSPKSFELPVFRIYGLHPNQDLIKTYEEERKQIKSFYQGRDEVDVALDWLTR